jgi:signal transduction histidine kinase
MRRTMSPMFFVGVGETALLAIAFPLRALFDDAGFVEGVMWLLALSLPATAIAFFAGLLRSRLFAGRALRRLAWTVQSRPSGHVLRRAIAETLEDPTTDILFLTGNAGSRWTDADGEEATLPRDDAAREIHFVRDGSAVAGAIVYGANAGLNPQLLDAASGLAAVAIANQRLQVDAESALRDARQSRERMVSTADRERRRLERDLHDGAQQRLVALRIELGLLEETVTTDPEHAVERIRELQEAADEALEELRALGHGILPPLLADRGLREALRATAARCTLPVDLRTRDLTRYPPEIESTVYFCVLEALQNAEKHALGAQHIVVELDGSGPREIRFLIYDDGQGASEEAFADGAGMTNMRDRLGALGGEVRIASSRGIGTSVRAWVPTTRPV